MATPNCSDGSPLRPAGETRHNVCLDDGFCVRRAIRVVRVTGNTSLVTHLLEDGTEITNGVEVACPQMTLDVSCRAPATGGNGPDLHITQFQVVPAESESGSAYELTRSDGETWTVDVPVTGSAETLTTLTYDAEAREFTYTSEDGTVTTVTLTPIALDANITSVTDNGSGTYTFHLDGGEPDVVLDLSALLRQITVADSATVDLNGAGTTASPLIAAVKVSADAGNIIEVHADGIFAEVAEPTPEATEPLLEWGTNTLLGYVAPAAQG